MYGKYKVSDMNTFVDNLHSDPKYWTQKRTQSKSIHSTILDVQVLKAERQKSPFLSGQLKLDKELTLSPQFPPKLVMDRF